MENPAKTSPAGNPATAAIALLETSRSFLSLDEMTVASNSEGPELRIDLKISTLFARDTDNAVPGKAAGEAGGPPGGAP